MSERMTDQLHACQRRGKKVTLVILLLWVAAVFIYSILRFAKVIG